MKRPVLPSRGYESAIMLRFYKASLAHIAKQIFYYQEHAFGYGYGCGGALRVSMQTLWAFFHGCILHLEHGDTAMGRAFFYKHSDRLVLTTQE